MTTACENDKIASEKDKVVLAYSGGLDTSVAIRWLQDKYGLDVIAVAIDVGQQPSGDDIVARALRNGALKAEIVDAKEEFVSDYIWPSLKANAVYQNVYPLSTAVARPLITKVLVEVARREGAKYIAHGCTAKGNDQVRFDVGIVSLEPELKIIAPMREWVMTREEEIEYARQNGVEIKVKKESPYSRDENLWGCSCECGVLEDPWAEPPEDAWEWTVSPQDAPDEPAYVEIEFKRGAGGAGRKEDAGAGPRPRAGQDRRRERGRPHRSRGGPSGRHKEQGDIRMPRGHGAARRPPRDGEPDPAEGRHRVQEGSGAEVLRAHIQRSVVRHPAGVHTGVRGEDAGVRHRNRPHEALQGSAVAVGRKSPHSLSDTGLSTYAKGDSFDHTSAVGFIYCWGLPNRTSARAHKK
jgi:argininosuccinate synthase